MFCPKCGEQISIREKEDHGESLRFRPNNNELSIMRGGKEIGRLDQDLVFTVTLYGARFSKNDLREIAEVRDSIFPK